ncbi:MAG: Gfo/Idh/MocA family oxidoreductase [Ignavibacteriales bacterium]|nr:Gfo/Idh/MocA family oxidoreductase [Ignavibacteriales bacterium]
MKNFAITGVAGYIAPRHLQAIKDTNNNLIAAFDPHDSVGILDKYFPNTSFFVEFERFERHVELLRRQSKESAIDYLSICSPNFLHDAHIRLALRSNADAICEKPIVLNPWNLDALEELEGETGKKVYNILQLREHDAIINLKNKVENEKKTSKYEIILTYITSRGLWYDYSWKGVIEKSGGVATNIGIHFFDMLGWIFGKVQTNKLYLKENRRVSGLLEFEKANVRWFLSLEKDDLPENLKDKGIPTFRSLKIDNEEFNFSEGFTDLHTKSYKSILTGEGFGLKDARQSIEIAHKIRNNIVESTQEYQHPILTSINK